MSTPAASTPPADPKVEAASVDRTLSAALLRLRVKQPFFGALALFARYEVTRAVPTAATDGRTIFVNPGFWNPLTPAEQDGLLLHELLHAALGHCWRRGVRDPQVWNIAADIVINGMIFEDPLAALPKGGMRDLRLENFGVEEVYELLQRDFSKLPPLTLADLLTAPPGEDGSGDGNTSLDSMHRTALAGHWRHALEQAAAIARSQGSDTPGGLKRELEALDPARLDWRAVLWRYLVRTPSDFSGFDRRHLARGLYLEQLEGESVRVWVCVDTSGSVRGEQLAAFLGEVQGILRAYPHILCDLYFADAALHGPTRLTAASEMPTPVGGGGTDFRPFFAELERAGAAADNGVAVYLTDGFGTFPPKPPSGPTLWVVIPGGLPLEEFPFGETVRMIA
jgi:predicted metal-dependent peptidase